MIISKVHGIVSYDQSPWLEKYIDYHTKKRAEADSEFKKDYHNGLSISFFAETMEDVRNRIRKKFVINTDEKIFLKHQSRLEFDGEHKNFQVYDSYTFKQSYQDGETNLSGLYYSRTE